MKKLFALILLALLPSTALAFSPKEMITFGAGVKWDHTPGSALVQNQVMWLGASLKLPLNDKVGILGTFDRDAVDAPIYSIRAGVWFRL